MSKEDVVCVCVCIYICIYIYIHTHTYVCVVEYYSAMKRNEIGSLAVMWMDLEGRGCKRQSGAPGHSCLSSPCPTTARGLPFVSDGE